MDPNWRISVKIVISDWCLLIRQARQVIFFIFFSTVRGMTDSLAKWLPFSCRLVYRLNVSKLRKVRVNTNKQQATGVFPYWLRERSVCFSVGSRSVGRVSEIDTALVGRVRS